MTSDINKDSEIDDAIAPFEDAVKHLLRKDVYLLENKASERAITHKLGEYLQPLFPELNVDCEYNRNLKDSKRLHSQASINTLGRVNNTFVPDVIVHKRGTNEKNLLVIEAKATHYGRTGGNESDKRKLEAWAIEYGYKVCVFVLFYTKKGETRKCECQYFCYGEWFGPRTFGSNNAIS